MSTIPTEVLLEAFLFLKRDELATVSTVNNRFHQIVSQHLPKTPLRLYTSLILGPTNKKIRLEKPIYRGGQSVVIPECEFPFLVSPPFIQFQILYLTCSTPEDCRSWLNRMRYSPRAFEQTSTLVLSFTFEPKLQAFEELLNNVPLPSVRRLEIDYKLNLPVRQDVYFFNCKIFHNCRSINIFNAKNVGLTIKGDDIVRWLHSDPSANDPKYLNVAIYLSAWETEKLLNDLEKLFQNATTPCSYFLHLRGYQQSGATDSKRNEVTQENWQAQCIPALQCLTVMRTG